MPRDNAKTLQLLNILEDPKGRQEVDATDTPDTSRLERAAKAARFPINVSRGSVARLSPARSAQLGEPFPTAPLSNLTPESRSGDFLVGSGLDPAQNRLCRLGPHPKDRKKPRIWR